MVPDDVKVVDFNGHVLGKEDIFERLRELKQLVLEDNKLKTIRTDDEYLLRFLHCCDFNVQEAFKRMQKFHNLVEKNSDWFVCSSPSERKKQLQMRAKAMLQGRDKEGRSIYLFKMGKIDVNLTDPKKEAQLDELWFESVLNDFKTQANGISIIIDIKDYSWKLMTWLTPTNLKLGSKTIELFPCKEFIYHVVNTSFLLKASLNIMWPFLHEDMKKRIKIHSADWSSLHEYVSPEVLPPEYGGNASEVNYENLEQWFLDQDARIRKCLEYRQTSVDRLNV